jgi:hypothetical protein
MPQRSLRGWSTGGENRINKRAQRTDGIGARIARITNDNHLDGTKPADVCSDIEILKYLRNLGFQVLFQVSVVQTGHRDLSNLRDVDLA